ncbi:MAG: hypothetical protein JXC32_20665 [Anaerolineae bacterium]|nr:hypothetical protein [Anaerolineae bacterium]
MNDLLRALDALRERVAALEGPRLTHYRGTSAIDFTTTTLPHHGDYGYQTTDAEIQVNCNGTIRAITTAAL